MRNTRFSFATVAVVVLVNIAIWLGGIAIAVWIAAKVWRSVNG